jgi:hypothetical protein
MHSRDSAQQLPLLVVDFLHRSSNKTGRNSGFRNIPERQLNPNLSLLTNIEIRCNTTPIRSLLDVNCHFFLFEQTEIDRTICHGKKNTQVGYRLSYLGLPNS